MSGLIIVLLNIFVVGRITIHDDMVIVLLQFSRQPTFIIIAVVDRWSKLSRTCNVLFVIVASRPKDDYQTANNTEQQEDRNWMMQVDNTVKWGSHFNLNHSSGNAIRLQINTVEP